MALRLSEKQFQALIGGVQVKRAKWGNVKTPFGELVFDSKLEACHYAELLIRQRIGEVRNLARQVPFPLKVNSQLVCTFKADFVYEERVAPTVWRRVVADCKSDATRTEPAYRIKNKLMRAIHGIKIVEVFGRSRRG